MTKKKFRVLLVDDHPAMRESVADAIADYHPGSLEVVGQAGDGVSAVELTRKQRPDVVVLDLGLPRMEGVRVVREIKKINKGILIVVVSMYDDQAHVVEAIRAGADDYLFKQEAKPSEIAEHILKSLEKTLPVQDRLHSRLFTALRQIDEKSLDLGVTKLTEAELAVLQRAAFRGLSMKAIAQASTERDARGLSELTVRKHFEHIYQKLGAQSQAHAVCLAIKYGFISPDGAEPAPEAGDMG